MENTQDYQDYQDYRAEILGIVRSNASPGIMRNKLEDYHENDLADVFPDLSVAERRKLCRILNLDMLADIFEYIDEKQAAEYLDEMDVRKAAAILSRMETDAVVDVLRMIPKEKRALLLELMDDEARKDMAVIAAFDDEEIGSRMTTNYIEIRENLTVKQAMTELVSQAAKNDNISTIFMVTADHTFYGAMDLKDLITARQDTRLEDLIVTSYPYVYGHELIDDCIEKLKDYSENSIPILDNDNKLLGVITSQSIVDLVDDEMGEDYAMFAGLTAEEDLKEPLKESMKKRLPWLLVLLALGTVVSSVVGVFEQVVSQLTIIMCFQSLILDMAGNVGTQSLAVTIRVLMDESLTGKQKVELETYIQMAYFDRILRRANLRFMTMSSGQYELKRQKAPEDKKGKSGLELNVIDHYNGSERSVKTLSGGESFQASLSLALGLSDEIQANAGGICLEAMFVDEGFGSLDEEALEQAIKALGNLTQGNRSVGIISHVAELKERIENKIIVTKERGGEKLGSRIEII